METGSTKSGMEKGSQALEGDIQQDTRKKLLDFQISNEQFKQLAASDPSYGFSLSKVRNQEAEIQAEAGNAESMLATKADFSTFMYKPYDWRKSTLNGELVSKVAEDAARQKAATDFSLSEVDAVLARFQERNKSKLQPTRGQEPSVLDGTKAEISPKDVDIDLSTLERPFVLKENKVREKVQPGLTQVDIDLGKMEAGTENASHVSRAQDDALKNPPGVDALIPADLEKPDRLKKRGEVLEAVSKSQEQVERIETLNDTLKKESLERLAKMGLKKEKIESNFLSMKARPGFKIALGVALAGLSVATGGATSILTKAFSAVTFAQNEYRKEVDQLENDGKDAKKGRIVLKSLVKGIILALGTSSAISLVAEALPAGLVDSFKEKVSSFASSAHTSPDIVSGSAVGYDPGAILPAQDIVSPDAAGYDPEAMLPTEYTVQPGDSLTQIMKDQVISHFPGAENLTELQKENMIQNVLKYAADHPQDASLSTLHQFSNSNLIHPGDAINLSQLREAIAGADYSKFGFDTLLEHAQTLKH
jgi:hypothetical protein